MTPSCSVGLLAWECCPSGPCACEEHGFVLIRPAPYTYICGTPASILALSLSYVLRLKTPEPLPVPMRSIPLRRRLWEKLPCSPTRFCLVPAPAAVALFCFCFGSLLAAFSSVWYEIMQHDFGAVGIRANPVYGITEIAASPVFTEGTANPRSS